MSLAIRLASDPAPVLAPVADQIVRRVTDSAFMAALQQRSEAEILARFADGHRAYVAWRADTPAAWGWVATRTARIGEVDATFSVPERERYLWNFVTLPAHRGHGIYPRLLDAIVQSESAEADVFWIIYAPENHASGAGIRKAGFTTIADLSFDRAGRPAVHAHDGGHGTKAAAILGLPETPDALAPCWRCARNGMLHLCAPGTCSCDYQALERVCAG